VGLDLHVARGLRSIVAMISSGTPTPSVACSVPALVRHLTHWHGSCCCSNACLAPLQLLVVEHAETDALASRFVLGQLDGEAMMAALLDPAQIKRVAVLVADHEPEHFGIKLPALGQVLATSGRRGWCAGNETADWGLSAERT